MGVASHAGGVPVTVAPPLHLLHEGCQVEWHAPGMCRHVLPLVSFMQAKSGMDERGNVGKVTHHFVFYAESATVVAKLTQCDKRFLVKALHKVLDCLDCCGDQWVHAEKQCTPRARGDRVTPTPPHLRNPLKPGLCKSCDVGNR